MTKIKNLHSDGYGGYIWYAEPDIIRRCHNPALNEDGDCCYFTDDNGDGIWYEDNQGVPQQIVGTCQFQACKTASGTRRKLNKLFDEGGW